MRKIVVSGACTMRGLANAFSALFADTEVIQIGLEDAISPEGEKRLESSLDGADFWVHLDHVLLKPVLGKYIEDRKSLTFPEIYFDAFHPDQTYARPPGGGILFSATADCHSAICLWGYINNLSVEDTASLFRPEHYERLGYYDAWTPSVDRLRANFEACNLDFKPFFLSVKRKMPFMYTFNHPRNFALAELACLLARKMGCDRADAETIDYAITDWLEGLPWPVYPGIADRYGLKGAYIWRYGMDFFPTAETYVAACFEKYRPFAPDAISCDRLSSTGLYSAVLTA